MSSISTHLLPALELALEGAREDFCERMVVISFWRSTLVRCNFAISSLSRLISSLDEVDLAVCEASVGRGYCCCVVVAMTKLVEGPISGLLS
jgi:flagellar biosynthesis/type III secretory pathway ATPase